jgi:N-acetyl-anhydromuramyl-L-alanine amidase AmpD
VTSGVVAVLLVAVAPLAAFAADSQNNRAQLFSDAAKEFNVPVNVLLAVSYNESRWDTHGSQASVDGGYGLMNLTSSSALQVDGRGDPSRPVTPKVDTTKTYTLDEASKLLDTSTDSLKHDDKQNIRGAAAVLAEYAKQTNDGTLPSNASDWYAAVAKFSGNSDSQTAQDFADSVYQTMQSGAQRQTSDKQVVTLDKNTVNPNKSLLGRLHLKNQTKTQPNGTDCPSDLTCRFVSAGYAANGTDPADYGNYDPANRPKDMQIKYIVIHDTEGSYDSAIDHFQDTTSYVSAHYVIRSSDGAVTETVRPKDVAWGAGNWYMNMHSINIEHEGFASDGAGWYTEAMYQSSAKLVRYLAKQYNISLDRQHIIGHDEISKVSVGGVAASHWDPGAYWDWNHYMDLVQGKTTSAQMWSPSQQISENKTVEISPNFATNQPEVTDCASGTCLTLPQQGANFVYLHTQPNTTSPLLNNKYMHPDGSPGTTQHQDWSAKATDGQRFVVADTQGDWTGIWYDGKVGWFYNPHGQNAHVVTTKTVQARAGLGEVPVYVTAFPEASAYPADVPPAAQNQLYSMPKDQLYAVLSIKNPTDYFYDATINSSKPHDHEIFVGQNKYVEISYNHRVAFVNANDIVFK